MNGPLMLDLEAEQLSDEEISLLLDERVGGVILFSRNFSSAPQVKELCQSINAIRNELIIAVDQEGGRVQRFVNGFTRLPAVAEIPLIAEALKLDELEVAKSMGWLMATEVRSVNVDISFAPVLDIDHGNSQIIGNRAFSSTSEGVIELAGAYIHGMKQAGMAACGKHFPGHGMVTEDSHLELPIDRRTKAELYQELEPFKQLTSVLQGIMPAHVLYPQVDNIFTAGFSSTWINNILRKEIAFNGVVFSDDLTMEGAAEYGSYPERAEKALTAGCDMVLVCNNPSAVKEILNSDVLKIDLTSSQRIKQLKNEITAVDYEQLQQLPEWRSAVEMLENYQIYLQGN